MRPRQRSCLLAAALLLIFAAARATRAANPDALWHIVHDNCVPDQQTQNDPKPCEFVSLAEGYAILKDIRGQTQFLLIPTARLTGIESPALLTPAGSNYFRQAWAERHRVSARAGKNLPDDDISLAINSVFGRTQNQLHIHIDCVRQDVHATLAAQGNAITDHWAPFPVPLAGHPYRAIRLPDLDKDPFAILAASLLDAERDMGRHTLVLTPAPGGGFVLLDDVADASAGDRASGEDLQDHACAIAADRQ